MIPPAVRLAFVSTILACGASIAAAQPPAAGFLWEGEVTGTNVYVRSGAGSNWYPTTKLDLGSRVLVLDEKFGWYKIAPPEGSFSYIDAAMVQRSSDGATGTLTADRVYVRAGSTLNRRKSASQMVLPLGATVKITGEADGFYKIVPPRGAALYISTQYVKRVAPTAGTGMVQRFRATGDTGAAGGRVSASAGPIIRRPTPVPDPISVPAAGAADPDDDRPIVPAPVIIAPLRSNEDTRSIPNAPARLEIDDELTAPGRSPAESPAGPPPSPADAVAGADVSEIAPPEAASTGRYNALLVVLESELDAELRRPYPQRRLNKLLSRYDEIAKQEDEFIPGAIARIRVRQINDRVRLREARSLLITEGEELDNFRRQQEARRSEIARLRAVSTLETFDLEGELRVSYAFGVDKRRFRLVDPIKGTTIAYVDVPATVEADPRHLIGRYVGIRTARRSYSPSARTSIAEAVKIVDLTPRLDTLPPTVAESQNIGAADANTNYEAAPPVAPAKSSVAARPEGNQ